MALPLTAVLVLGATPAQMGALQALEWTPKVLFSLVAGVWIDRSRRRPLPLATVLLALWAGISGLAVPINLINVASLRQAVTPDALQGRVNATLQFLNTIPVPLGSLLGGGLGDRIGTRAVLAMVAGGFALVVAGCFLSPLRAVREVPAPLL